MKSFLQDTGMTDKNINTTIQFENIIILILKKIWIYGSININC